MTGAYMLHNEVNEYISGPAITDYISPTTDVAKTGIHSGDTIVHFDSVENPTWEDILNHASLNPNQTVPFSYIDDGKRINTTLTCPTPGSPDKFSVEAALALGLVPKMQNTRSRSRRRRRRTRRSRRPESRRPDRQHRRPHHPLHPRPALRTCRTRRASPRFSIAARRPAA